MSKISDMIRAHNIGTVGSDAGEVIVPENVECLNDLSYGKDPVWNVFDIYYEKSNDRKHPTLISIHGGGWVSNTKESYAVYCLDLAARGFNVINCTFRLAPEDKHPAMIEDINTLMVHLCENAEKYGLDMEHVFMVGDSAGGHMLAMYAAICTNPEYAATFDFRKPEGFVPLAIALNCGVYEILSTMDKEPSDPSDMLKDLLYDYMGENCSRDIMIQNNPIQHVTEAFPPTYLQTGNADVFQDQFVEMEKVLAQKHVVYKAKNYGDENTRCPHVFHLNTKSEIGRQCTDDEISFFGFVKKSV